VAQALITPMPIVAWNEVNNLDESVRGTGGFGSTGHN
jgi:dUTP pyrophosphatase